MKQRSMKRKNRMNKAHNKAFETLVRSNRYVKQVIYMEMKGIKRAVKPKGVK